jgi:solute carrier family 25 oxoglutarate transporter 11
MPRTLTNCVSPYELTLLTSLSPLLPVRVTMPSSSSSSAPSPPSSPSLAPKPPPRRGGTTPPTWTKFAIAGLGGASGWMFVHPMDLLKTRLQLAGQANPGAATSLGSVVRGIYAGEGLLGFYSGLSAALTRQITYTSARVGLYDVIREQVTVKGEELSLVTKLGVGLSAGAIAAFACNPIEVCLIRMQADGSLPVAQRRNYKHIFHALASVGRAEGIRGFWAGATPTVTRGMVVSSSQLATYDHAKTMFAKGMGMTEGPKLHIAASVTSGFIYCTASLPFDILKTRLQNQQADPKTGKMPYSGPISALTSIIKGEGPLALWRGFWPYFARGGGHTVGMFLFAEKYKEMVARHYAQGDEE